METNFFPKLFCSLAVPAFIITGRPIMALLFGALPIYFCDGGDHYA